MSIDRWLKRLWMTIGIVLLPIVLYGAVSLGIELLGRSFGQDDPIQVPGSGATDSTTRPRAVRYDQPVEILGSEASIIMVRYGVAQAYEEGSAFSTSKHFRVTRDYEGRYSPAINVIFLSPNDSGGKLLLDKPAYISRVSFPAEPEDSLITWIAYEIALDDTNGDGRLGEDDEVSFYVSDLAGRGLTRVLPQGQSFLSYRPGPRPGTILVYSLQAPADKSQTEQERWQQRAFEYSLETRTATPYPALENQATRAGQILSR